LAVDHDVALAWPSTGPTTLVVARSVVRVYGEPPVDVGHQQECRRTLLFLNYIAHPRFPEALPLFHLPVKASSSFTKVLYAQVRAS
jgi:hypothetical protein